MGLPAVTISKPVFTSASSPNVVTGILAICAGSQTGTVNSPGGYSRSDLAVTAFGQGPLADYCAYNIAVANTPTVLVKANCTYTGSYNGLVTSGVTGSCVVTTTGTPLDHYSVIVTIVAGGTVGVSGITYTASVDGGTTTSGVIALGTNTTLNLSAAAGFPFDTGVAFSLTTSTLNAGDQWTVFTERPLMNNTDITNALGALFQSRLPFEGIYVDCSANSSTVATIDGILSTQEANGIFKFCVINSPYKLEPEPTAETEAAYATRMGTLFNTQTSIRECVGADGAHVPSTITGFNLKRPTGLMLCSRAMAIPIGTDPAYVALGPVAGATVSNAQGNPFDHDEGLFPDLDSLRLTALRTFPSGGPQGVYITNANTIQPSGGSYPYLQHIRIMNAACSIAWQVLTTQLSRGVRKNPTPDPVTGAVYIFEPDAASIESLVNTALAGPLKGQVNAVAFTLSRTDNLNTVPTTVTGILSIVPLAYIKGYAVTAEFSKTLQTTL